MTEKTGELIAEAEEWAECALPTSPWGEKHVVHRLTVALAALTTPQAGDARERLHAKCDCVPNLGPAHCHLCGNEKGEPVPWPECSAVRAAAPEPEPAHEMFPGTTEALNALTIRKDMP